MAGQQSDPSQTWNDVKTTLNQATTAIFENERKMKMDAAAIVLGRQLQYRHCTARLSVQSNLSPVHPPFAPPISRLTDLL